MTIMKNRKHKTSIFKADEYKRLKMSAASHVFGITSDEGINREAFLNLGDSY